MLRRKCLASPSSSFNQENEEYLAGKFLSKELGYLIGEKKAFANRPRVIQFGMLMALVFTVAIVWRGLQTIKMESQAAAKVSVDKPRQIQSRPQSAGNIIAVGTDMIMKPSTGPFMQVSKEISPSTETEVAKKEQLIIQGRLMNSQSQPISDALIKIKGLSYFTARSDRMGRFRLSFPRSLAKKLQYESNIIVSATGYPAYDKAIHFFHCEYLFITLPNPD